MKELERLAKVLSEQISEDCSVKGTISFTSRYSGGEYEVTRCYNFLGKTIKEDVNGYSLNELRTEALDDAVGSLRFYLGNVDENLILDRKDCRDSKINIKIHK